MRCVTRVWADVGAVADGILGPWCLERMVNVGGGGASGRVLGPRRGWRAMNATNGYVVAWSFWDASLPVGYATNDA